MILHLRKKFPIVVFDSRFPLSWDHATTFRSGDSQKWIVADERALEVLLEAASRLTNEGEQVGWHVRSSAYSCFEWNRRGAFNHGRLYLDTTGAPIWKDVSALVGDDVERSYDRACRWLKSRCVNMSRPGRGGFWVSHDLVRKYEAEEKKQEEWHRARPKDPRDARFYKLANMSKKRRTKADIAELVQYSEAMVIYVQRPRDNIAEKQWEEEVRRLRSLLDD